MNVTKSSMPSYEECIKEIAPIWDSVWLTNMGPKHNELKAGLCKYLKVGNAELFTNGHLALYIALKAMGIKGEVITTPFTFASTTNAIIQAGATPVFCDIKDDYTIDESKIEALITENTSAIMPVHVYGNVCDVYAIQKIADKHGLKVIYDAAHVFGVEIDGRGIGSFGDASMFSFHATKVFHTIEGGGLTFADANLAKEINKWRNFGIDGEDLALFGTNAKMNEFQASMGLCNLRHIDEEIAKRKAVFARYFERLNNVDGITILTEKANIKMNYAYYPVLFDSEKFGQDRDEVCTKLASHNIYARKYFYPLTSENKSFDVDKSGETPTAKEISRNILCLPLYADLTVAEVDAICDIILSK